MTISEEIIAIANRLASQGKKPSVALIKTRLSRTVPLPTIITVLKNWQYQPNEQASEQEKSSSIMTKENKQQLTNSQSLSKQEFEQMIAQALLPLKTELTELKQQIQEIKSLK